MQFTVPIHITLNNTQQVLSVYCTSTDNIWTCQCISLPDCLGVNTDLQAAIKEVIDNVKIYHALDQNNSTSKEI